MLALHWWTFIRKKHKVNIRWIRGHNGTVGNERADALAKQGCAPGLDDGRYRRAHLDKDWDEQTYVARVKSFGISAKPLLGICAIRGRQLVLDSADGLDPVHRILDGAVVPSISDFTKIVATVAGEKGRSFAGIGSRCDNSSSKDLIGEEKALVKQRKEEGHTVRRKLLCKAIFKIRKIIKQKKIDEWANRAVQQQRVPLWAIA